MFIRYADVVQAITSAKAFNLPLTVGIFAYLPVTQDPLKVIWESCNNNYK
jgi:hypothetical protein